MLIMVLLSGRAVQPGSLGAGKERTKGKTNIIGRAVRASIMTRLALKCLLVFALMSGFATAATSTSIKPGAAIRGCIGSARDLRFHDQTVAQSELR